MLGSGNNTITVTKPAGVQSGDVMVTYFYDDRGTSITPPAGWTTVQSATPSMDSSSHSAMLYVKVAGGSEPSNYTWSLSSGTGSKVAVILAYRPAHATQLDASGTTSVSSPSGSLSSESLTTLRQGSMLVYAWMMDRTGSNALGAISVGPAGMTQRYFSDLNTVGRGDMGLAIYEQVAPLTGAVGARVLAMANSNISCFYIRAAIRAQGT